MSDNMTKNETPLLDGTSEKTRTILDAAITVFARKGYYGARVSDIAREAGIAYGLVYHYFKNKEDLLISIFKTRWEELISAIRDTIHSMDDPEEMIKRVISFLFHSYKNNPQMVEVMIMDVAKSSRFFNEENIRHFKDAFGLISEIVKMGQERGIFKQNIDRTLAAYAVYGAVERIMLWWILDNTNSITDKEAKRATDMLTSIILEGLATVTD
jgi:AcrR family transcriptional regulator